MRFIYIIFWWFILYKSPELFFKLTSFCIVMFLFEISCELHKIKYLLKEEKEQC